MSPSTSRSRTSRWAPRWPSSSRAMAPTYCARPVRVRTRNCPHRGGSPAYTRTMATTPTVIDRARIAELTEREAASPRRAHRRPPSAMYERARDVLTAASPRPTRCATPWPIYLERGDGPRVWDVDGNEMCDFHNGFGSMVQGHAHPAIGAAISERYALGHALRRADRGRDRRRRASSSGAGACRAGATRTPARSRRWTRSASPAPTPAATRS